VVHWGGERAYLYLWALVQCLIFAFMWVYPNIIQPMFNKFEALKDEELHQKIKATEENERERQETDQRKHAEEVDFLKKGNQHLKDQLEALLSAPKKAGA